MAQSLVSRIFEKGGGAGKARRAATPGQPKAGRPAGGKKGKSTRWVLDSKVRGPVPDFVLEMTHITTPKGAKKTLLDGYNDKAMFEQGKPLPAPKKETSGTLSVTPPADAAKEVKASAAAKPPKVRKAASKKAAAQS